MKVLSLFTSAAAAAIVQNAAGLPVRETSTAVGSVANSDNMPSGSESQPFQASGSAEDSQFLQKLFSQKQDMGVREANLGQNAEKYIRSLMKEYAANAFPIHHRKDWLAGRSRTDLAILRTAGISLVDIVLSKAEQDLLFKHNELINRVESEEVNKAVDEASAVMKKFDPYIVCENLYSSDKITMKAIYTNKAGHQMETTVTCDGDSFKLVKIPKDAKDLKVQESVNDGPYREIVRAPSGDYRSTKGWRSSSPSSLLELAGEKMSDLDKLVESGDTQAVKDYASDIIKAFGKKDKTGIYKAALAAKAAAMQAEDELETAQKWFDITAAAKQRAKAARAMQRGSEL